MDAALADAPAERHRLVLDVERRLRLTASPLLPTMPALMVEASEIRPVGAAAGKLSLGLLLGLLLLLVLSTSSLGGLVA